MFYETNEWICFTRNYYFYFITNITSQYTMKIVCSALFIITFIQSLKWTIGNIDTTFLTFFGSIDIWKKIWRQQGSQTYILILFAERRENKYVTANAQKVGSSGPIIIKTVNYIHR